MVENRTCKKLEVIISEALFTCDAMRSILTSHKIAMLLQYQQRAEFVNQWLNIFHNDYVLSNVTGLCPLGRVPVQVSSPSQKYTKTDKFIASNLIKWLCMFLIRLWGLFEFFVCRRKPDVCTQKEHANFTQKGPYCLLNPGSCYETTILMSCFINKPIHMLLHCRYQLPWGQNETSWDILTQGQQEGQAAFGRAQQCQ